jgi:hypothetical protein
MYNINNIDLIIIGQQQRCGGTLLNRLFDDHSQILSYPFENFSGKPLKYNFPNINIESSNYDLWEQLKEPHFIEWGKQGEIPKLYHNKYNFIYNSTFHQKSFIETLEKLKDKTSYNIFKAYLISFFIANKQITNKELHKVKYILYFTPRQCLYKEEIFKMSIKIKIIHIIRNPLGFYNSAKSHDIKLYSLEYSKLIWRIFYLQAITSLNLNNYSIQFFENIVENPKATMKNLSKFLNINYTDNLVNTSLNGQEWLGDSHFEKQKTINPKASDRYKKLLTDSEKNEFTKELELYKNLKNSIHTIEKQNNNIVFFENFKSKYKENFNIINIYKNQIFNYG